NTYNALSTSISAPADRVDGKRDVELRIGGIRKRFSKYPRLLPSGLLRLRLPRRVLWQHRTKGEHEQKCCPAVEHDFLRADETGPFSKLLKGLNVILQVTQTYGRDTTLSSEP